MATFDACRFSNTPNWKFNIKEKNRMQIICCRHQNEVLTFTIHPFSILLALIILYTLCIYWSYTYIRIFFMIATFIRANDYMHIALFVYFFLYRSTGSIKSMWESFFYRWHWSQMHSSSKFAVWVSRIDLFALKQLIAWQVCAIAVI